MGGWQRRWCSVVSTNRNHINERSKKDRGPITHRALLACELEAGMSGLWLPLLLHLLNLVLGDDRLSSNSLGSSSLVTIDPRLLRGLLRLTVSLLWLELLSLGRRLLNARRLSLGLAILTRLSSTWCLLSSAQTFGNEQL